MTTLPKRIQRKRIKGWRMPDDTIYVGRPTPFGNPFEAFGDVHCPCGGRAMALYLSQNLVVSQFDFLAR